MLRLTRRVRVRASPAGAAADHTTARHLPSAELAFPTVRCPIVGAVGSFTSPVVLPTQSPSDPYCPPFVRAHVPTPAAAGPSPALVLPTPIATSLGWLRPTARRLCASSSPPLPPPPHAHHPDLECAPAGPCDTSLRTFDQPEVSENAGLHNEYLGFFFRTVEARPHPDKVASGGEDSYMATDYALGVADGVGWWDQLEDEDKATDKASSSSSSSAVAAASGKGGAKLKRSAAQQYSETFMRAAHEFSEEEYFGQGDVPVDQMAEYAYEHSARCKKGSCTVSLATVVNNHLQVYTMGDCVCLVVRCGQVIFRSEERVHGLNFPFQLGVGSKDMPSDGTINHLKIRRGDIVVLGSDGIFDNVFDTDIISILKKHDARNPDPTIRMLGLLDSEAQYKHLVPNRKSASTRAAAGSHAQRILKHAAKEIIDLATSNTNDPRANTPFAAKCLESGAYHEGGKLDDMTLVMASVASSLMNEGVRFGTSDFGEVPPPYKNWPASTQYID